MFKVNLTDTKYLSDESHTLLLKKCSMLNYLQGLKALRLSYLYDGSPELEIPPLEIFYENNYKEYNIKNITV